MKFVVGLIAFGCLGGLAGCGGKDGSSDSDTGGGIQSPAVLAGTVQLSSTDYSVNEDGTAAVVTITRVNGSGGALDVTVTTADASAKAGEDYVAVSTTLRFAAGDTASKTVDIPIVADTRDETDETFTVTLTTTAPGTPTAATITIRDDDSPGTLQLSRATFSVGEGGGSIDIGVTRTGGSAGAVSAIVATRDVTALAGQDYSATTATVSFADGDTATKTVSIPILNDAAAEPDETFEATLSGATGGAVLGTPAVATITVPANDQPVPPPSGGASGSLQLSSATLGFAESAGNAVFTVTRVGGNNGAVSVRLTTAAGTALAGQDFTATNVVVSFANGDSTSKIVTVPILDDAIAEDGESLSVALSTPTGGATIGSPSSAIALIQDDDPPAQPVLSLAASTKQFSLSWPAVATATHYKLFLNPDGISGFTQVGADLPAATLSTTVDVSVHRFNWPSASLRLEACNAISCRGSASVSALSSMLHAIGYFKADGLDSIDAGDRFGASVAVSADGSLLAVGAPDEDSNAVGIDGNPANDAAAGSGAVYVFARTNGAWARQAYLKSANSLSGDQFGSALAVSNDGNTLAVGAPGKSSGAGAVYLFTRTGSSWAQQGAQVTAANAGAGDHFGAALALSRDGTTLAVGAGDEDSDVTGINSAQADNNAASGAGAAYVFVRNGNAWQAQAYIKPTNAQAGDLFGSALALSDTGAVLAIGAVGEASAATTVNGDQNNNAAPFAGAVYVFTRTATAWSQTTYLKAENAEENDRFGGALSLSADGSTLAIGAALEDGTETGALSFPLPPPPLPPTPAPGSTPPPGAPNPLPSTYQGLCDVPVLRPSVGCESGAVYVYVQSAGAWTPQAYLKGSNNQYEDRFGSALSLSADGNSIAVGSPREDSSAVGVEGNETLDNASDSGAAYVFTRTGATWTQQAYVKASNTDANDAFGGAVALSGDATTLAIGAIGESSNSATDQNNAAAALAGAAYLY